MAKQNPVSSQSKVPPRSAVKAKGRPSTSRRPSGRTEANRRRRNRRLMAIGASALVVVIVVVLVVVKVTSGSSGSTARGTVTAAELDQLSSVPVSTLVAAANDAQPSTVSAPTNLPASVPALTSAGKPEIVYIGAEYCPYCAAERWAMVMALSKFGTFTNLGTTKSSSSDTNPDTPTFSFYGSTYKSPYITFTPVETEDRLGKPLQTMTKTEQQLATTYDAAPYVSGNGGSIPFIDLGGKFLVSGTQYDGSALSGKSFSSAVPYMVSASNPTSRAAEAVAGHLIGTICALTNDQPASVCSAVPATLKTGVSSSSSQGSSSTGG